MVKQSPNFRQNPRLHLAGARFRVKTTFLGQEYFSGLGEIVPGLASRQDWTAEFDGGKRSLYENGAGIPASQTLGKDVLVTVEVRDAYGNMLPDGTLLAWDDFGLVNPKAISISNADSAMVSKLQKGRASFGLRNSEKTLYLNLAARVDDLEQSRQVIGTKIDRVVITRSTGEFYREYPQPITITARAYDIYGSLLPSGVPIVFADSKGVIQNGTTTLTNGVATTQFALSQTQIDTRLSGRAFVVATVAGVKSNPNDAITAIDIHKSPTEYYGSDILIVDHRVLSIEDNRLRLVEVPRSAASDLQVQQFSSTAVHANTLTPSRSYRITIEGVRGNGIYLSNSGPIPRSQTRPTSIAIPAGSSSYDVMLYSDGSDIASEQGMQKVRLKLQDWNVFQFGWQEVESVASWQDVIVGQRDVATSYEIGVGLVGDFLWGALAGSDNLDAGLAGDMTISLIPVIGVYTDIRDLGKQIWYSTGLSNKQFSSWEASLAALGIVAELFPPADYFVDGARFATKILKNGRTGAQAAQVTAVLTAIAPIMLDAIEALWNRAMIATPQSPSTSPSNNYSSLTGGGSGEGELLAKRGEGAGSAFWDAFELILKNTPGDAVQEAAVLVRAISKNNSDFVEGIAKMHAKFGGSSQKMLKILIGTFGAKFDDGVAEALKISKLPDGGGDEAFLAGLVALAQAVGVKQSKNFVAGADELSALLASNASPRLAASLIVQLGRHGRNRLQHADTA